MQLHSVKLIQEKAENTGDKGMYPRASRGLDPALFKEQLQTCISIHSVLYYGLEFQLGFRVVDLFYH